MALIENSEQGSLCERLKLSSPPCSLCADFLPSFPLGGWACWNENNRYDAPERIELVEQNHGHCEGFKHRTVRIENYE